MMLTFYTFVMPPSVGLLLRRPPLSEYLFLLSRIVDSGVFSELVVVCPNAMPRSARDDLLALYPSSLVIDVEQHVPEVSVINDAVAQMASDYVFLLEPHLMCQSMDVPTALSLFNASTFAVSPELWAMEGAHRRESVTRLRFFLGMVYTVYDSQASISSGDIVDWAPADAMICDRIKFLSLGGFDALFDPYGAADIDLCLRARSNGWHVRFSTAIVLRREFSEGSWYAMVDDSDKQQHWISRFLLCWRYAPSIFFWVCHSVSIVLMWITFQISRQRAFSKALWRRFLS